MKKEKTIKERRFEGFFLMDSGLKVEVDISEEFGGEEFQELLDARWPFERGDTIWLGEEDEYHILADRIVGFRIDDYEEEKYE